MSWSRFCPMVNGPCTDGKPNQSELSCAHWDSLEEECLLISQGLLSVAFYRRSIAKMDQLEEPQAEMLRDNEDMAAELEANLPKADEFGRSLLKKRADSEVHEG